MRWSILALVVLGLVAAVCAAVLVAGLRARPPQEAQAPTESDVEIVVATGPLKAMHIVSASGVRAEKMSKSQRPASFLGHPSQVVGKVLSVPMVAGQAFTPNCFVGEGSGAMLAAALPKGKRAIALNLTGYSSLEGLLYPGSIVDILVSLKPSSDQKESVSTTLLKGIQVLAVEDKTIFSPSGDDTDTAVRGRTGRRRQVTVMVDPEQAQALQLAMTHGTVSLAMRNPMDTEIVAIGPTALAQLSKRPLPRLAVTPVRPPQPTKPPEDPVKKAPSESPTETALPPAEPSGWKTVIIRGQKSETLTFPAEEGSSEPAPGAKGQ